MKSKQTKIHLALTCLLWGCGAVLAYHSVNMDNVSNPEFGSSSSDVSPETSLINNATTYTDDENNQALQTMEGYQESLYNSLSRKTTYLYSQFYEAVAHKYVMILKNYYDTGFFGIQDLIDTYYPLLQLPAHKSEAYDFYRNAISSLEYSYIEDGAYSDQRKANVISNEEVKETIKDYQTQLSTTRSNCQIAIDNNTNEHVSSYYSPILQNAYDSAYGELQTLIDNYYWTFELQGHDEEANTIFQSGTSELESIYYQAVKAVSDNQNAYNSLKNYQERLTSYLRWGRPGFKTRIIMDNIRTHWNGLIQGLIDEFYEITQLHHHTDEADEYYNNGIDELTAVYYSPAMDVQWRSETVTAYSSPSFTVSLNPNGGTAEYFNGYYRLGNGGSLTLWMKNNIEDFVRVTMNLQEASRTGSNLVLSSGTLNNYTITNINDTVLTITSTGSWPQLWISSFDVTYYGLSPERTYAIRLPQYQTHGTVTSDMDWADEGDEVTLTATPEEGYHLARLYANRGAVTLTASVTASNQYTFTMPAEDVTIGAVFAEGDVTTGVLLNVPEDGETATNATPIYNLQGQCLTRLQRGVNIIGGRKIVKSE